MNGENANNSTLRDDQAIAPAINGDFTQPLGTATSGRLVFASGAVNVHMATHPDPSAFYAAHFERQIPSVWVQNDRAQESIITVQYRRFLLFGWLGHGVEPLARVALNSTIPWEIEARDGISRLTADLRQIHLRALDLGSVSTARLILPAPVGAGNIYLSGSASDLSVQRPRGVALRLQIGGSASRLSLDEQRFGAVSGGIQWQTPDYNDATDRYDISIAGSVSNMIISTPQAIQDVL